MFAVQEKPRVSHVAFWDEFVPAALKAMPKPTTPKPCVDSSANTFTTGKLRIYRRGFGLKYYRKFECSI